MVRVQAVISTHFVIKIIENVCSRVITKNTQNNQKKSARRNFARRRGGHSSHAHWKQRQGEKSGPQHLRPEYTLCRYFARRLMVCAHSIFTSISTGKPANSFSHSISLQTLLCSA